MSKLNKSLRKRWDTLIETEGAKLGLVRCRPFLENKMVNDVFYEGVFNGRECIVKCSSKDPQSIRFEYETLKRLHAAREELFPEPFACVTSADGRMAMLISEKVTDTGTIDPATALGDVLDIARTLEREGIVHRDIYRDNFFFTPAGHLKLFDFQFSIDRNRPYVSRWLAGNWKYHFVVFARVEGQPPATWNDISALRRFIKRNFKDGFGFAETDEILSRMEERGSYRAPVPRRRLPAMIVYLCSLTLQRLFTGRPGRRSVIRKRLRIVRELIASAISKKT